MSNTYATGGGGGGTFAGNGAWVTGSGGTSTIFGPTYTTPNYATTGYLYPSTTVSPCISTVLLNPGQTGSGRLRCDQVALLIANHKFIPMDQTGLCLFCFALDEHRSRADHDYVIREE